MWKLLTQVHVPCSPGKAGPRRGVRGEGGRMLTGGCPLLHGTPQVPSLSLVLVSCFCAPGLGSPIFEVGLPHLRKEINALKGARSLVPAPVGGPLQAFPAP